MKIIMDICKFMYLLVEILLNIFVRLGKCIDIWLFLMVCLLIMFDFIFCRIIDIWGIDIIRGFFLRIVKEFNILVILFKVVMVLSVIIFV